MVKRVSITDVAREAGVSPMTVSRVVRGKEDVSDETRARVLEWIERLGYQPNAIARGLVTQRTGTIGLIVPYIVNPFFSDIALAVETEVYEENFNIFLCNTSEDPKHEIDILKSLQEKRVDGIILCSSRLTDDELREAITDFPVVVLVNRYLPDTDTSAVMVDDFTGGYVAAKHLLSRGHEKVGYLAGPATSQGGKVRVDGFNATLDEAKVPRNPDWQVECPPTIEEGFRQASELITRFPEITALVCYNDIVAIGALQACVALQRNIPSDIAVVGFDDIPMAALVTPALTTCRVPRFELGIRAANLLLTKLDNAQANAEKVVLRPELVVRDSA